MHAILWREAFSAEYGSFTRGIQTVFLVSTVPLLCCLLALSVIIVGSAADVPIHGDQVRTVWNVIVRLFAVPTAFFACSGIAFRAAGSFCHERERRTLTGLLLIPCARWEIVCAKWLGVILRWRFVLYALGGILLLATTTTVVHPLGTLLFLLHATASIAFLSSFGLCLSLAVRRMVVANVVMALALFGFFLGAEIIMPVGRISPITGRIHGPVNLLNVGLNPLVAWWESAFTAKELEQNNVLRYELPHLFLGPVLLLAAAGVFWMIAWWLLAPPSWRPRWASR